MPILVALLLQTAASSAPPASFSILADPCAHVVRDGKDVVVCGRDAATAQRLPYPEEIVPNGPVPSNPLVNGRGALASEATPCAARIGGCPSGVFPPIIPAAIALAHGVRDAAKDRRWAKARARDGARRQSIDLGAAAPAGRVTP